MEQVIIRACNIDDTDAIFVLNKEEMGYDYPIEQTRERLKEILSNPKSKIFVAVYNNTVVGYVHANNYDLIYAPHMKNIMGIAVSNDYKKMGIGKMLLYAIEKWAKETGACDVRLVSGATRTEAHEFYRHCGYNGGKKQLNFKKTF